MKEDKKDYSIKSRTDNLNGREYFEQVAKANHIKENGELSPNTYTAEQIAAAYFPLTDGKVQVMDLGMITLRLSEILGSEVRLQNIEKVVLDKNPLIKKLREDGYDHVVSHCKELTKLSRPYDPNSQRISVRKLKKVASRPFKKH